MKENFDVGVIGAGVNGSSTAFHLAKEGKGVVLLEQFELTHEQGQSYGESRMFSVAYGAVEDAKLALHSKDLWHKLERLSGKKILFQTGGIDIGDSGKEHDAISKVHDTMQMLGIDHEVWEYPVLRQKLPMWCLPENSLAIYSPHDAIIPPTHTVIILLEQASCWGTVIRDQERVTKIFSGGSKLEIVTTKKRYAVKRLVITCGVWTNKVLSHLNFSLPIQPTQEQTVYFRPKKNTSAFALETFPMWYHRREPVVYGFPIFGKPGVKVGFHRDGFNVNINEYDKTPRASVTKRLRDYLYKYLPDAAGEYFSERTCLYDQTPDDDCIVDLIPGIPNVFVGAGFSGHGFGPAIAVGRALADLVIHGKTDIDITRFNIGRFSEKK